MLKIAIVFPKDSEALFNKRIRRTHGGANVQMYNLAREFGKHDDIRVYSLIPDYGEIDFNEKNFFSLVKIFKESDSKLRKVYLFHKKIQSIKPEVIIQRGLTLISCGLALYCWIYSIKFIFMFAHDIEYQGRYQRNWKRCFLFGVLLRFSSLLLVQNESGLKQISSRIGSDKVRIQKKVIDTKKLITGRKNIKFDAIWIARCEKWKNPEIFLKLAERNPNLTFGMICSIVPGREKYYEDIKYRAEQINNLTFFENLPNQEVFILLLMSRVFCITSDLEGDWPMTVLEATLAGLPILSFKLNYGSLIDSFGGGYCSGGKYSVFEDKLNEMLENKKLFNNMAKGAKEYIMQTHMMDKNTNILLEYIRFVCTH